MSESSLAVLQALFEGLSPTKLEELDELVVLRNLSQDENLFREGDEAIALNFVVKGRLAVVKDTGFNGKCQAVALLGTGSVVGESAMNPGAVRGSTVVAVEESVVAEISAEDLDKIGASDPVLHVYLLRRILAVTSMRLAKSSERLAHVL